MVTDICTTLSVNKIGREVKVWVPSLVLKSDEKYTEFINIFRRS